MSWENVIRVAWLDRKLTKITAADKTGRKHFGAKRWTLLRRRIVQLEGAPTLVDLDNAPGYPHQLSGDRAEQFAMSLDGPFRLVFTPDHDPMPRTDDGGIDRARVTQVLVLEVADYHGR
jgi:proteic killer suppression protein